MLRKNLKQHFRVWKTENGKRQLEDLEKDYAFKKKSFIITTQLPQFLGLTVSRHEYILPTLSELVKALPALHIPTFAVGLVAFGIIYGIQKYRKTFPLPFL